MFILTCYSLYSNHSTYITKVKYIFSALERSTTTCPIFPYPRSCSIHVAMAGGQVVEWGHYTASIHCRTYCPGPASHRTTHLVLLQSSVNTVMYTQAQYVRRKRHIQLSYTSVSHQFGQQKSLQKMSQYQVETTCLRICLHKLLKCESTRRPFLQDSQD